MIMGKQCSTEILKERIRLLEIKQAEEGQQLKAQLLLTYESLKPINLLKSSVKELVTSDGIRDSLFKSVVLLVSGFLSNLFISKTKGGPFLKMLASLLQLGATNFIGRYSDQIQDFFTNIIDRFMKKPKEEQTE
jgi:hypothetical protein